MTIKKKDNQRIEFGDFQTPDALAAQVVSILNDRGIRPLSVVEPTCGAGSFVLAAMQGIESARQIVALEINPEYFALANSRLIREPRRPMLDLRRADFFSFDWQAVLSELPEPVLLLGNPPWVTSSGIGALGGSNLPEKSNFQRHRGLDAITGKGNFDIAEWMLIKLLESATGKDATLAMLVKTSVARRVLSHSWRFGLPIETAAMYEVDAAKHFGVAASACLLVCKLGISASKQECEVFEIDTPCSRKGMVGLRDGALTADAQAFDRLGHLLATKDSASRWRWRSGVKHDRASIMELYCIDEDLYRNGLGEEVRLEREFVFPMMKGSHVARRKGERFVGRWMIVPQRATSEDTVVIRDRAPRTWAYLSRHGEALDKRGSSIYRNRPRFAVFGIGPYTFAPWKVAICGLYKRLEFVLVGPECGKPVVFDDTVYHLSFDAEEQARAAAELLNSDQSRELLSAFIFWDAKRPITVDVLRRLDLVALARVSGFADLFDSTNKSLQEAGTLF